MTHLDSELQELGFEWSDIEPMSEIQKLYVHSWETRNWEAVLVLQNSKHAADEGLEVTEDERELAQRYHDRS